MSDARLQTATDVRRLLAEHGLAPRRRDGQTFVVDPNTVRAIVADAGVGPGDRVLEVGPGLGALTLALRAAGAQVVAVELDRGLVRACGAVVGHDPGVQLVHADALTVDLGWLLPSPLPLVANLPYHAATPIVLRLLAAGAITRGHVMVQREVGERWSAGPGDERFGAVSVKVAAYAEARVARRISRQAFFPVPGVDSVTVDLVPRPWPHPVDRAVVLRLVEAGFTQRRKQLTNTLAAAGHDRQAVADALTAMGLPADARAERLDLSAWAELTRRLTAPTPPRRG